MKHFTLRQFPAVIGLLVLTLGLLLPVSCSREVFIDFEDDELVEMTITVGSNTRTTNDGNGTTWTEGDDLTVIHSATSASTPSFWPSQFLFYGGNAFHGTVSRLSATNNWYAVYPYAESNASANDIVFTLPSTQKQQGNASRSHLAGKSFPLFGKAEGVARSTELNLPMKNLLAVAKFNVTNNSGAAITIKEIEYTASSPIAGTFSVDLTGETPVFNNGSVKTVKLNVYEGTTIAAGATTQFYMAIAPYEAAAGTVRQVKVVATDGTPCYRTYNTAVTFKSGVIKNIDFDFDKNHQTPQIDEPGTAGEVELEVGDQPEDGVYLLVYKNGETSMAFAAFDEYKSQKYAIPVTVVDNQVLPQEDIDLSRFAITIEKAGIEHPNDTGHDAYNVKNSDEKFIFYASGGSGDAILRIQDTNTLTNSSTGNTVAYYHTFVQATDGVQILSSGSESGYNKYLLAYTSANGFYYEQDNNGQKLHLYLLGGSAKEHQELTFSADNVTYNFDTNGEGPLTNAPTLSGDMTPVTWSSNNVSVATVDNSGNVTIHGVGTAVITAKAEADETYYSDSASYTIEVTSSSMQIWYKADEMEAGKQYLIVSNGYALQNNNGSVAATAVTVSNETITLNAPSGLLWTANSSNQLTNNNQSLGSSNSSSGYGWGSASLAIGSNAATWTYDAESNLLTCNVTSSSMWGGSTTTTYYLYYSNSSNAFTINSSSSDTHIAALYSTTKPADKQFLSFANPTVRWTVGDGGDHALNQSYDVQAVSGAATTVTYTSSDTGVATINGTRITLKGTGATTITATAKEENGYKSATAQYTLRISTPAPGGFEDLGTINLENAMVKQFLDRAYSEYNDNNLSTTIVSTFSSGASNTNRLDVPNPVVIDWGTRSSGTTTITIFSDQDLTKEVWTQTASSGSTSDAVYNLTPGKTYYCTVEDNTGYLLKGVFETEGRRRMMRVSTEPSMNRANNCRDLGGMSTSDGRKIKYGMIFRGTNLDSTKDKPISNYVAPNNSEQGLLANYMNVGYDIDLRAGGTKAFSNNYSVVYVLGNMDASVSSCTKAENARPTIQGFFDAAAAGKASYFHCAIGSDRTGFWGLLIEGLLGVSIKECSIDYELTSFARNVTSGDRTRNSGLFSDGISFFKKQNGSTLQEQVENYVKSLSNEQYHFTDEAIEAFRNAVLE